MTGIFQKILPKHSLSRIIGMLCKSDVAFIKKFLISIFCSFYEVNLSEAKNEYCVCEELGEADGKAHKIKYINILTPFFYSKNIEIGGGEFFEKIFLEKHQNRFDF